jgi:hypothetical protein
MGVTTSEWPHADATSRTVAAAATAAHRARARVLSSNMYEVLDETLSVSSVTG